MRLTLRGMMIQIGCSGNKTADGRTVISEVWYYGHHIGRVVSRWFAACIAFPLSINTEPRFLLERLQQDGNLKPIDAVGSNSSCSPTAGKQKSYLPH
jgi:hypothetical protein